MIDRMAKVLNRAVPSFLEDSAAEAESKPDEDELLPTAAVLPMDPQSFTIREGIRSISLDGPYGRGIKALTEAILGNALI